MSKSFMRYLRYGLPVVVLATSCGAPSNELTFNTVPTTLGVSTSTTTTIAPSERVESIVASGTGTTASIVSDFTFAANHQIVVREVQALVTN
jgi:hypothetical protein